MTDFVLEQRMTSEEISKSSFYDIQTHICKFYDKVFAYANFLKQPLMPGMFVPCDLEGDILEKPSELTYELYKDNHLASILHHSQ